MDDRFNRRYQKLKVDKGKKLFKNTKADLEEACNKDEQNFKIERFMKDVKRFSKHDSNRMCGDGLDLGQDKVKDKGYKRKEGLFLRGIIPKAYNKGLMPLTLSARLNEDLEKMIQLANGRKKKCEKFTDKKIDKVTQSPNELSVVEDVCSNINNTKVFSPFKITKTPPLQLNSVDVNERNINDLYIQFTHYVTRSLFNSGTDKSELKSYSDSIKESLVEVYHSNLKENIVQGFSNSSQNNSNLYLSPSVQQRTPSNKSSKLIRCPLTSKSEDGPTTKIYRLTNDSQMSDDVVIRKSNQLMFASGVDYLKAVYSGETHNNTTDLLNESAKFSPVQPLRCNDNVVSPITNNMNVQDNSSVYKNNVGYQLEHTKDAEEYFPENYRDLDENFCHNTSKSLRYYPGMDNLQENERSFSCNNNYLETNPYWNTYVNSTQEKNSQEYISLLPPSQQQNNYDNLRHSITNHDERSYLTIPIRPQLITSPDIQFKPRRMF